MARGESSIPSNVLGPRLGFLVVSLILILFGLVVAYSASAITAINYGESPTYYLVSQGRMALVGLVFIFFLWKVIPMQFWRGKFAWIAWGFAVFLIILVALVGDSEYGAQRWLPVFGFRLQPAEFVKPALALVIADLIAMAKEGTLAPKQAIAAGIIAIGIPIAIIYLTQSDLGTTIICAVCILAALVYAGVPARYIVGAVVVLGIFGAFAIFGTGYRNERWIYLHPYDDGEGGYGSGYQTIRSLFAFADGGLGGVGLGNSREKYLYLPAINTDYVFAAIGEELGLIGCVIVIVLFMLFLYFGLRVAREAANEFSSIVAASMVTMIVFQAFLNIGCGISLFPMTGKPLPFISVGGSSLLATLIMVGFVLAVSKEAGVEQNYAANRANLRILQPAERAGMPPKSGGRKGPRRERR